MHALARMIQEVMHAEAVTLADIARRSKGVSYSRFQFYADPQKEGIPELPRPVTLRHMAHALGRSERSVLLAAAQACGIDVTDPTVTELAKRLPAVTDRLTAEDA